MNHKNRVIQGPGIGIALALALTWLLLAAAAWSMPHAGEADDAARTLEEVRLHIVAGRLDQALLLADAVNAQRLSGAERAELQRMVGYAEARRGRYSEALAAYEAVLAEGAVLDAEILQQTRYTAAQLCFALGRYRDAVGHLQSWQAVASGDTAFGPHILLGQAYFKVNAYQDAIRSLETGLARAAGEGAEIREHWLQLLHYLYVEQQQWSSAVAVLERLSRLYPKPEYQELLGRSHIGG